MVQSNLLRRHGGQGSGTANYELGAEWNRPECPPHHGLASESTRYQRRYQQDRQAYERLLQRVLQGNLSGKEYLTRYLTHQHRRNRRANTLGTNVAGISLFLRFLQQDGISHPPCGIKKEDVEAFVEHQQDRGAKPATVYGRLNTIYAFLRFLVELGVVDDRLLKRKVRIKLPEYLPRAMDPDDVKTLLGVVDGTRDRAMVLMLLRTGMRIGELLELQPLDVDLNERKAMIYEAGKTGVGRVVYFTDDARDALRAWFEKRDLKKQLIFYGMGREELTYSGARRMFRKCIGKAGLSRKGYTLHCLRHTFASELLNAGMRLECLQQLLGHTTLEVTRRYARLTDKTREEEYFRAMAVIEGGGNGGHYRFDHKL